jgi:proteasome accessory factor B
MLKMHQRLQAGSFPNCRKLADELEVSTKTIQRNIDFMRDQLGLPIEYDQLHFGFVYTEPVTHFPSIEVSEGEVVALFVAQKALEQYRGTSFEKPLRTAFEKITGGLKGQIGFQWGDVDSAISFRGLGASVADLELFEMVSRAVLDSHELAFEYKKLGGARHEARRVQPYHLGCVENQWYLFGFNQAGSISAFALPRIRPVKIIRMRFRRPADFRIAQHLGDSCGVFKGKAPAQSAHPLRPFCKSRRAGPWKGRVRGLQGSKCRPLRRSRQAGGVTGGAIGHCPTVALSPEP